jgi:hypothetical protein
MEMAAGELRLTRRMPSKDPVLGEGSMEYDFLQRRTSSKSLTPKASKGSVATPRGSKDLQKAGKAVLATPRASKDLQKVSEDVAAEEAPAADAADQEDIPESAAAAAKQQDAGSEDSGGSQSTEPQPQQFNLARTYAVTLYSSDLCSNFDSTSKPAAPSKNAKARSYAVNLQKDPSLSPCNDAGGNTPPPPISGIARRRSVDFSAGASTPRLSELNAARPTTKFHVWTDSDKLSVKTPEIAATNGDAQAWIRVAFKPNSQPRRTREFVYIEEAESKVPLECVGFDLEYI